MNTVLSKDNSFLVTKGVYKSSEVYEKLNLIRDEIYKTKQFTALQGFS